MTSKGPLTVYKASAGSGKTYTLAYEYIKMLLGIKNPATGIYSLNPHTGRRESRRHRYILAITFTNAATNEMKERIVKELNRLAAADPAAEYTRKLTEELNCSADDLRKSAHKALCELLYDYSAFNVSTIDSFFQNVLRTFWHELQRQGDYILAIDSSQLLAGSLSQMLDTYNYGPEDSDRAMREWIRNFMTNNMLEGETYNIFDRNGSVLGNLTGVVANSMDEKFLAASRRIRQYLSNPERPAAFCAKVKKLIAELLNKSVEAAHEFERFITDNGLVLKSADGPTLWVTAFYDPDYYFPKSAPSVFSAVWKKEKDIEKKLFNAATLKKANAGTILHALELFGKHAELVGRRPAYRKLNRLIKATQDLQFLGFATDFLNSYLRDKNTMLIGESGQLLSELINGSEVPFIYERIGTYLRHLLIDEFQDTSRTQWTNLEPLVRNSLDNLNECLIIGDVKQSIYRFRNSDSSLLDTEVENNNFPGRINPRGAEAADNTNHRSAHGIVRFNNTVFSRMATQLGIPGYANVAQTPSPRLKDLSAYVKVSVWGKDSREAILETVAQDILRQHSCGYRWRDILVLVYRHDEGTEFIRFITDRHKEIPVLSSQSLLLCNSRAVRSIMALLKLVAGSYGRETDTADGDDEKIYSDNRDIDLMRSRFEYFAGVHNDDLQLALDAALDNSAAREKVEQEIEAIRRENSTNLVAMIEAIVYHRLAEPADGTENTRRCKVFADEQAFIAALIDRAIEHMQGPDPSVRAFLKQWENEGDSWAIPASKTTDAVEVMTIHVSKGLERNCIHIPFINKALIRDENMWLPAGDILGPDDPDCPPLLQVNIQPDDLLLEPRFGSFATEARKNFAAMKADTFNSVYVAFTRARRELCVHTMPSAKSGADPADYVQKYLVDALEMPAVQQSDLFTDTAACSIPPENLNPDHGSDAADEPDTTETADPAVATVLPLKVFVSGEPTSPRISDMTDNPSNQVEFSVSMRKDLKNLTTVDDILAVSDLVSDDDFSDRNPADIVDTDHRTAEMRQAADDGMNMHAILENMNTIDDLAEATRRQAIRRGLDAETAGRYFTLLDEAFRLGGETVRQWFMPQNTVFAERAIFDPRTNITKRPDRVVGLSDGTMAVIDYKFTSEAKAEHRTQLRHYLQLVSEVDGKHPRGFLWYPRLNKIIEITQR